VHLKRDPLGRAGRILACVQPEELAMAYLQESPRSLRAYLLLVGMIVAVVVTQTSAMAQQAEPVGAEPLFRGLTWGMPASTLRKTYGRSANLVEAVPGVLQDLDAAAHDLGAFVSFWVGPQGLHFASASFFFTRRGQRFSGQDVIAESRRIVGELGRLYGKPHLESPWNGSFFSYVWLTPSTLIQFAWNGGDNWAIQYRSRKLDADAQTLLRTLR